MSLYDLLTSSRDVKDVSLLWIRERYLKEFVKLGGRRSELIYKGSMLDVSRSYVGPISGAVEFSIFQNCWDGMHDRISEDRGTLSGLYESRLSPEDGPEEAEDLRDYRPSALYSLELIRVDCGGSTIWEV